MACLASCPVVRREGTAGDGEAAAAAAGGRQQGGEEVRYWRLYQELMGRAAGSRGRTGSAAGSSSSSSGGSSGGESESESDKEHGGRGRWGARPRWAPGRTGADVALPWPCPQAAWERERAEAAECQPFPFLGLRSQAWPKDLQAKAGQEEQEGQEAAPPEQGASPPYQEQDSVQVQVAGSLASSPRTAARGRGRSGSARSPGESGRVQIPGGLEGVAVLGVIRATVNRSASALAFNRPNRAAVPREGNYCPYHGGPIDGPTIDHPSRVPLLCILRESWGDMCLIE